MPAERNRSSRRSEQLPMLPTPIAAGEDRRASPPISRRLVKSDNALNPVRPHNPAPTQRGDVLPSPPCLTCQEDQEFLRSISRPEYEALDRPIRVADLFCGGGGLSLGAAEAARR